ncbi:hypothetical protein KIL84_017766 [Mauremys mutica]|uniref:Uncharacterized protein n=1 Tax=Mauremys mutica TaxID=74926 RepID=A0A9D3X6V4_9SAUR|nr:hypothetical protein KIL84_017766 [Mauremys mutica]
MLVSASAGSSPLSLCRRAEDEIELEGQSYCAWETSLQEGTELPTTKETAAMTAASRLPRFCYCSHPPHWLFQPHKTQLCSTPELQIPFCLGSPHPTAPQRALQNSCQSGPRGEEGGFASQSTHAGMRSSERSGIAKVGKGSLFNLSTIYSAIHGGHFREPCNINSRFVEC